MSGSKAIKASGLTTLAAAALAAGLLFSTAALVPAASAQGPVPIVKKHLYPGVESAQADLKAAFAQAKREHKRVLIDFGGDWCGDCQVLDVYFNQAPNADLLAKNYVKVNINIGHMDANLDIAKKYGVPVHGVPALAVVDANGTVVVSQDKEFADMRHMESASVTDFLTKWKR